MYVSRPDVRQVLGEISRKLSSKNNKPRLNKKVPTATRP